MEKIVAEYLIETPLAPEKVAEIIAGEQSSGTFVRVPSETDELRERSAAEVMSVEHLEEVATPSLHSAWIETKGLSGPFHKARIRIGFPPDNIGANLPTLAATVSGNLYDLGEVTGLRLVNLTLPADYRARFQVPAAGTTGTRLRTGNPNQPFFGSIIKPNVGMRTEEIADLVESLCEAGVDFIKDDEVCADPAYAPLSERIPAIMARIRAYRDRTGRDVMMAFNITDETDAMRRHADLVEQEGGNTVMVSINWVGLSAMQSLRKDTPLMLHAHRNGFGGMSRHPALGMSFPAFQVLYRLAGIDQMHVHGMGGKFCNPDEEVIEAARICGEPLIEGGVDDRVLPVFSSGQWAGTILPTYEAVGSADFMFLAGGGILAHPGGPAEGVVSLQQAWEAAAQGITLADYAKSHTALADALSFFGSR